MFTAPVTRGCLKEFLDTNPCEGSDCFEAILELGKPGPSGCQGVYSVTMELALQKGNTPYVINKIRLDFGAFLWSISFLPVMGYLGIQGR